MSKMVDRYRSMNPPKKGAHTPETQLLTLALYTIADNMPDGWRMGFSIADDAPLVQPDGSSLSNLALHDQQTKGACRRYLEERMLRGSVDAADELAIVPPAGDGTTGCHVHIQITHRETGVQTNYWIDRQELHALAVAALRGKTDPRAEILKVVTGDASLLSPIMGAVGVHVSAARKRADKRIKRVLDSNATIDKEGVVLPPRTKEASP